MHIHSLVLSPIYKKWRRTIRPRFILTETSLIRLNCTASTIQAICSLLVGDKTIAFFLCFQALVLNREIVRNVSELQTS
jgi:hypothetical protein